MTVTILLVADAGGRDSGDRWHVGDEAILEATIGWLRQSVPGTRLMVASSSPTWTRRLYDVDVVRGLDFGDDVDADAAAARGRDVLAKRDSDGAEFVAALGAADAVLFCGAGNLCSAFPNRLYERVTIAGLAAAFDKRYAFSAQTIGPLCGDADRAAVARALSGAMFVGARDRESVALAADLGVAATPMADDALRLTAPAVPRPDAPIGVTLHRSPLAVHRWEAATFGRVLDDLADATGAPLRFIPHFRGPADRWSDNDAAGELRACLHTPMIVEPWGSPSDVLRTTAACRMVVSTRYHPLVFALGSGVPAFGLYQDAYHLTKMEGAMDAYSLRHWVFPADLPDGAATVLAAATDIADGAAAARHGRACADVRSRALTDDATARAQMLAKLVGV